MRTVRAASLVASAIVCTVALAAVPTASGAAAARGGGARLNDLQVLGTHNSFHVEPEPDALQAITSVDPDLVNLAVTHPPVGVQLGDLSVRQLELDVFADPDGSLWRPVGRPGFKVFHMEQIDMGSTCEALVDVPAGAPGVVGRSPEAPPGVRARPDPTARPCSPVRPTRCRSPPQVARHARRGDPFRDASPATWSRPTRCAGSTRPSRRPRSRTGGRARRHAAAGSCSCSTSIATSTSSVTRTSPGASCSRPRSPGQPDAAFVQIPDARGNEATISDLVRKGYLVRTRADEPVVTPTTGDVTRRDAAFASGATIVSTDYPAPGLASRWGSDYVARLPGGGVAVAAIRRERRSADHAISSSRRRDHRADPGATGRVACWDAKSKEGNHHEVSRRRVHPADGRPPGDRDRLLPRVPRRVARPG